LLKFACLAAVSLFLLGCSGSKTPQLTTEQQQQKARDAMKAYEKPEEKK
jgi:outer membrane biogenesis lipoprotein LolB